MTLNKIVLVWIKEGTWLSNSYFDSENEKFAQTTAFESINRLQHGVKIKDLIKIIRLTSKIDE